MSCFQKKLREYFRELKSELPGSAKMQRTVVDSIRSSVDCFIAENPNASFESVVASFGTAQEIADTCVETMAADTIRRQLKRKNNVTRTVAAVMLALVLFWGIAVTTVTHNALGDSMEYYIVEIIK